jgi:ribosomal peptide maturation radical SAM protein 1
MKLETAKPKVALVYPPFGPTFTPPLGLGLLSAGVKELGFECRTFFWGMDLISDLPGRDVDGRLSIYTILSGTSSFPVNEWIFAKEVFPQFEETEGLLDREIARIDDQVGRFRRRIKGTGWFMSSGARTSRPKWLNLRSEQLVQDLRRRAGGYVEDMANRLADYDIIGIATTFFQNTAALALAKKLKQQWPHKVTVLGGANCEGVMGQTQLEQFPFIDYVFSGEVDHSFPDFVRRHSQNAPIDGIPGIIYRDERGDVIVGPAAQPLQDLDRLPIPDFDDFVAARERVGIAAIRELMMALESARGCWWGAKQHCTFCGLNALGMGYRQKSQERFRSEVEEISGRYGTRHFFITDTIMSMSYFKDFAAWAKRSQTELNFFWEIKSNINRQQATSLAQAGINWVQPGIENFSSEVLQIMKKGVKGIQNVAFLKYASENGLLVLYFIIYGFPGEQAEMYYEMERNVRKLVHLEPPRAIGPIHYDRFSPYHQNPESFGLRLRPASQYRVFYPFSEDVMSRLVYLFERDDSPQFPYVAGLKNAVRHWQRAYKLSAISNKSSTLSWTQAGEEIVIDDRRPGFRRRRYRLLNHAVQVFHALDSPTTLAAVVKSANALDSQRPNATNPERDVGTQTKPANGGASRNPFGSMGSGLRKALRRNEEVVSFTREEFDRRPAECLERLVENGVIYVEGDWYLALPVARGACRARATTRRWQTTTFGIGAIRGTPWYQ